MDQRFFARTLALLLLTGCASRKPIRPEIRSQNPSQEPTRRSAHPALESGCSTVVVTASPCAELYEQPNFTDSVSFGCIPDGQTLDLLSLVNSSWATVRSEKHKGYMARSYISCVAKEEPAVSALHSAMSSLF